jgi:hypothetical protein
MLAWDIQCTARLLHHHWQQTTVLNYDTTFWGNDTVFATLLEDCRGLHQLTSDHAFSRWIYPPLLPWQFPTWVYGDRIYRLWTDTTRSAQKFTDEAQNWEDFDFRRGLYKQKYRQDLFANNTVHSYADAVLTSLLTSVQDEKLSVAPLGYSLLQNYPNPFNPTTTIRYGMPERSHVMLSVFNTLGQMVAVLEDGERAAGYHEVKFDGKGLSSGVYFYRIQAGTYVETKKLLIVR